MVSRYDLLRDSSFTKSEDQSDYQKRMDFQAKAIESESWDTGKVINDHVYREKQRA